MKTRPKPAPAVPTFDPDTPVGKLALAYSKAIDKAVAVENDDDTDRRRWHRVMAAFDKAEEALFDAMKAAGLRAVIVGGRLYLDIQTEEHYIPDRPQHISYQTFGRD